MRSVPVLIGKGLLTKLDAKVFDVGLRSLCCSSGPAFPNIPDVIVTVDRPINEKSRASVNRGRNSRA